MICNMRGMIRKLRNARKLWIRWRLRKKDFTIISINCLGGVIYHKYGHNFQSPTINLFFKGEDFVKFVDNLHYYLSLKPEAFVGLDERKKNPFPVLTIGDIKVYAMHYRNPDEAIECWERRKKRVNRENILVIANEWNLNWRPELIKKICSSNYPVVCFTYNKYPFPNAVQLKGGAFLRGSE